MPPRAVGDAHQAFVSMFVDAVLFVKIISGCLLVVLGSRGDTH